MILLKSTGMTIGVVSVVFSQTKEALCVLTRIHHKYSTAALHIAASAALCSCIRPRRTVKVRLRSMHSQALHPQPSAALRYENL